MYYYQLSNYDCGPTCLINALSLLLARGEIVPEFIKTIYQLSLDDIGEEKVGYLGTSQESMRHIAYLLDSYAKEKSIPLSCHFEEKEDVQSLLNKIEQGYIAIVRCLLEVDHYILVTEIDDKYIYAIDPYYLSQSGVDEEIIVDLEANNYNRIIPISRLNEFGKDFSLVDIENRCSVYLKTLPKS